MGRRWKPDGGPEWVKVLDFGAAAVWVRAEDDGATLAVYLGGYYDEQLADIWLVRVLRGSSLLDTVMDKPHRIRWVADNGAWDSSGVVSWLCQDFKVVSFEHRQAPRTDQGHPRHNFNRHLWLGDPLPRKVHEAVGYGQRRWPA